MNFGLLLKRFIPPLKLLSRGRKTAYKDDLIIGGGGGAQMSLIQAWEQSAIGCDAPLGEFSKPIDFLEYYEKEFSHLRQQELTIVEIGVFRGQFLETLARFLPNAKILGIEMLIERVKVTNPRITIVQGDQGDASNLEDIFRQHTPDGIDIMFDDASHVGGLTMSTYLVAQHWLKSRGTYYIEDWLTGYWEDWPDGEKVKNVTCDGTKNGFPTHINSHNAGMVGFIKSLVDHVGAPFDVGVAPLLSMDIRYGIVKLVKK